MEMQLGQFKLTPHELAVAMLVALGIMLIVRDILRAGDQVRMASQAEEYLRDPNKLAEEALEHLGQDPGVVPPPQREEEEQDG